MKTSYLLIVFASVLLLSACSNTDNTTSSVNDDIANELSLNQPERKIDIYGKVVSQEGNEITISQVDSSKDPTFNMTPAEKKKYMQSLDESTRMALKEEINNAVLGQVKVIIPVGIPMSKKTAQGSDAPVEEGSLSDIKLGGYLSIWLDNSIENQKVAEFVKISFIE
ncbi:MAG: hypothetical protein V3575_04145 [Candidatus Absconditabacteria bacterium]